MKISMQWLREWANPSVSDEDLMARLTMAGLEIDAVLPVAGKFSGVVVGEILSAEPHPSADKLRVCQVAGHPDGKPLQIVCGAANARAGIKIPLALVGAVLPPKAEGEEKFLIKEAKLRGVDSFGMLCGADELGIDIPGNGLLELPADAPTGKDLRTYLQLDDSVIEVNITPNRGDCLSVRGLSREVAVLTGCAVHAPSMQAVPAAVADQFPVELLAQEDCPRYAGRVIRNIDSTRPSPLWLQEKLRRSGIRSIDAVVDVTNYVLLELGQPMHAFDLERLQGRLQVRKSRAGEKLKLLNEQQVELKENTLLIADQQQPLALAGVMGGAGSAVSASTRHILLEAAYFDPTALAGKARSYGLHTDSSQRFERGVDPALQSLAIERATALLLELVGGEAGPLRLKEAPTLPAVPGVRLRLARVQQYLGLSLAVPDLAALLESLGMAVERGGDSLVVSPPSWRFDIRYEVDLLEEIARIYGYNRLPVRSCLAPLNLQPAPESRRDPRLLKQQLTALGYQEVITYSFVDPALQRNLGLSEGEIPVQNPISAELGVMRRSLLPGLLATTLYNLNRQQSRVRLFESGLAFVSEQGKTRQEAMLGLSLYGPREPESWSRKSSQPVDFYDIKGDVEALLSSLGLAGQARYSPSALEALHPGQSAAISVNGKEIGFMGGLHPAILQELGLPGPFFFAQLAVRDLLTVPVPRFEEISRFPEVRRDLALVVDRSVPVAELLEEIWRVPESYLTNLKVFDVYSGEGIDPQRKSVALGLTFRAKSRTLTDTEIHESVDRVLKALKARFQADLRS